MKSINHIVFVYLLIIGVLISSCVNYNVHYAHDAVYWPNEEPDSTIKPQHTLFLVGDAGGTHTDLPCQFENPASYDAPALVFLKQKLTEANENSSIIFLGDNIYPNGLAPKSIPEERCEDEYALKAQLWTLEHFKGKPFFIAGNHDWYKYGMDGVKRQKKFIESYLDKKDVFLPEPGCGDPFEVEINENLTFILLDSQWWLEDWSKDPNINDGCDAQNRDVFTLHLQKALRDHRDKNVVVAVHHPLYTMGSHGGQFSPKQHIFPIADKIPNAWIPLPILGSIYPLYRSTFGVKQDLPHPDYQALKNLLVETAQKNGHYIFASGHEHNLQYIEKDGQSYIVSGSGSKKSPTKLGDGWRFASADKGFAQLDFYADGSVWLKFWAAKGKGEDGIVIYRQKIKGPLEKIEQRARAAQGQYPYYESKQPTKRALIHQQDFSKGNFDEFLLGKYYRDVYNIELDVPNLDLNTFQGGVKPVKMGGGFQTNSLRLEAADGRQYTMRSLEKDPTKTVPYPFINSFVPDLLKEFFTSAHPLSALPIPPIADAVGVYHTNPKLYNVPRQPGLQEFNEKYGDALYLVEERPNDEVWQVQNSFGNPKDIRSTSKMVEKVLEKHDHFIDQRSVLRARLFDIMLGDWDRHDDQWRWSEFEQGDSTFYRPIPRDRDQAFSNYDGFLMTVARPTIPFVRQLRSFGPQLKHLQWSSYNARQFDRAYLTAMDWKDWQEEAKYIIDHLPDEVIEEAFRSTWPKEVFDLDAPRIIQNLKQRRDALYDAIYPLYKTLSRKVSVTGTEGKDLFIVTPSKDSIIIEVFDTNKQGEKQGLIYKRVFDPKVTKNINLYGLDDDDIFEVKSGKTPIKIRLVGGLGEDKYINQSSKTGLRTNVIVYDTKVEENIIQSKGNVKTKLSDDPKFVTYDRKSKDNEYSYGLLLPSIAFNPDDGILLGIFGDYTGYGFKKSPYATKHQLITNYALATSGFRAQYSAEFIEAIKNWNIELQIVGQSPLYAINFYGIGNDTRNFENEFDQDYHRVRQQHFEIMPKITKSFSRTGRIYFGPTFEATQIENTANRFIEELAPTLNQELFDGVEFIGLETGISYRNVNDAGFPTRGASFDTRLGWKTILNDFDQNFPYFDAQLAIYQKLEPKGNLALGLQFSYQHRFNNKFLFYQGARLGGTGPNSNFRGLRRERYIGKTAFVQNTDIRWRAFELFPNTFPLRVGLLAGFDFGRVWNDGEDSDTWHYSYGGGAWLSPFDLVAINFNIFRTDTEFTRFTIGGSFFF